MAKRMNVMLNISSVIAVWTVLLCSTAVWAEGNIANTLAMQLFGLDSVLPQSAHTDDYTVRVRGNWSRQSQQVNSLPQLKQVLLDFEAYIVYDAQARNWRTRRDAWVQEVTAANSEAQVGELMKELAASFDWGTLNPVWQPHLQSWNQQIDYAVRPPTSSLPQTTAATSQALSSSATAVPASGSDIANSEQLGREMAAAELKCDYPETIRVADLLLAQFPGQGWWLMKRGIAHSQLGNTTQALADLNRALQSTTQIYQALPARAACLKRTGDYQGAIRDMEALAAALETAGAGLDSNAILYGAREHYSLSQNALLSKGYNAVDPIIRIQAYQRPGAAIYSTLAPERSVMSWAVFNKPFRVVGWSPESTQFACQKLYQSMDISTMQSAGVAAWYGNPVTGPLSWLGNIFSGGGTPTTATQWAGRANVEANISRIEAAEWGTLAGSFGSTVRDPLGLFNAFDENSQMLGAMQSQLIQNTFPAMGADAIGLLPGLIEIGNATANTARSACSLQTADALCESYRTICPDLIAPYQAQTLQALQRAAAAGSNGRYQPNYAALYLQAREQAYQVQTAGGTLQEWQPVTNGRKKVAMAIANQNRDYQVWSGLYRSPIPGWNDPVSSENLAEYGGYQIVPTYEALANPAQCDAATLARQEQIRRAMNECRGRTIPTLIWLTLHHPDVKVRLLALANLPDSPTTVREIIAASRTSPTWQGRVQGLFASNGANGELIVANLLYGLNCSDRDLKLIGIFCLNKLYRSGAVAREPIIFEAARQLESEYPECAFAVAELFPWSQYRFATPFIAAGMATKNSFVKTALCRHLFKQEIAGDTAARQMLRQELFQNPLSLQTFSVLCWASSAMEQEFDRVLNGWATLANLRYPEIQMSIQQAIAVAKSEQAKNVFQSTVDWNEEGQRRFNEFQNEITDHQVESNTRYGH